jgi:hypothetical protein
MSSGVLLAHPSCLLPVPFPSSLFPVSYSLFPSLYCEAILTKLLACRPRMNELKLERRAKSP